MEQSLKGQVAVITGASGGLGAHFARVLAQAGAAVALTARRLDLVENHAGDIAGTGGTAMALKLDVADAASIGPALDEVETALGPISILVNNAGVGGEGLALDLSIEDWDRTFDVNVRGVFFAAQQAAKRMIASGVAEEGRARIINIASIASHTVLPGLSAYCASKASVRDSPPTVCCWPTASAISTRAWASNTSLAILRANSPGADWAPGADARFSTVAS